jgi:hypothetical protein
VDGPNLTTDTDWLVTLSLDIPQYPGHTASLSLMALQDCQQKNNYMIHNCKLEHILYYFIHENNSSFPSYALTMIPNEKSSCKTKFSNPKYQNTYLSTGTQTAQSPCVIMWMELAACCQPEVECLYIDKKHR